MTQEVNVLRIGIASKDAMRARTLAIVRGQHVPSPNEPKVWFASLESLAQVLSSKNRVLLELIRRMRPASITELAALSGRAKGNLSRTLRTMEHYGLVRLNKESHGRIVPEVPYDQLSFDVPIVAQAAQLAKDGGADVGAWTAESPVAQERSLAGPGGGFPIRARPRS